MQITQSQFMSMVRALAPALFKDARAEMATAREALVGRHRSALEGEGFVIVPDAPLADPSVPER